MNVELRIYHPSIASFESVWSWLLTRTTIDRWKGLRTLYKISGHTQPYDLLENLSEISSHIQLSRPHPVITPL
jgi:hypothetical protein